MPPGVVRRLHRVHRAAGLFVTANLLFLAVTGSVLIFKDEIDAMLGDLPSTTRGGEALALPALIDVARQHVPGYEPLQLGWSADHPGAVLVIAYRPGAPSERRVFTLDEHSGEEVGARDLRETFTGKVLALHTDLMLGQGGRLYVGFVGLVTVFVLVLGLLLYAPFMKRRSFGSMRRSSWSGRARDLHKAVGATVFAWCLLVALTGVVLVVGGYLVRYYLNTELANLRQPPSGAALPTPAVGVQEAVARADAAALFGDGLWEVLSWTAMAAPLVALTVSVAKSR